MRPDRGHRQGSNERGSARGRVGSCQRHGQRDLDLRPRPMPTNRSRCRTFRITSDSVIVSAPGFDVQTFHDVTVAGTTELSTQLERDWAALSGGPTIEAFDGSSPVRRLLGERGVRRRPAHGLGRESARTRGVRHDQTPSAVDIERIGLNPTGVCGSRDSSGSRPSPDRARGVEAGDPARSCVVQGGRHVLPPASRRAPGSGAESDPSRGRRAAPYSRRFEQLGELIVRGSPAPRDR